MIGSTELIMIVVVIVILFGSSAIPKFARSLGQAKREFEKGLKEGVSAAEKTEKQDSKEEVIKG